MPLTFAGRRRTVPLAPIVGADLEVETPTGRVRFVNLDHAGTTPALQPVLDAVSAALGTYGSVHRGTGFTSIASTDAYARARRTVGRFLGCRPDDHVVFTRNTTDSLNLLARALPPGTTVFGFPSEHHANLLPWRRGPYVSLGFPVSPEDAVERVQRALAGHVGRALVAVTGASNVTGELWPVADLVAAAHGHGARVVVDAAQLAPHRAIDMAAAGVDYLALSGHKLYAPFGSGVLAGRADWLDAARPYLAGGGAVERVGDDDVVWLDGPARHEAGTPNLVGAVALAAACQELGELGFARITGHEDALADALEDGLRAIRGVRTLALWADGGARVGVTSFAVPGVSAESVARRLADHGIGVRHGSFCAHPLVDHLVGTIGDAACEGGGAVRASVGLGSSLDDVERFLQVLGHVAADPQA